MKPTIYLAILLGFILCSSYAQHPKATIGPTADIHKDAAFHPVKSGIMTEEPAGEILAGQPPTAWHARLISFDKTHPLSPEVIAEKSRRTQEKLSGIHQDFPDENPLKEVTDHPTIGASFEGNWFDETTPPDNSMAISNGGYIVSVTNSHIEYFNTGGTRLFTSSFDDFFGDPTFTALLYDPSVIYDSKADRFFMTVLHGSNSTVSKVVVCFS